MPIILLNCVHRQGRSIFPISFMFDIHPTHKHTGRRTMMLRQLNATSSCPTEHIFQLQNLWDARAGFTDK